MTETLNTNDCNVCEHKNIGLIYDYTKDMKHYYICPRCIKAQGYTLVEFVNSRCIREQSKYK